MLFDLIDLLMRPDAYVCTWRDGELFVEPVPATSAAATESTEQPSKEAARPIAASDRVHHSAQSQAALAVE